MTSSVARLDEVIDNLSERIKDDKDEVQRLLDQVEEVRRRIVRNEAVRDENSKRLDRELQKLVEGSADSSAEGARADVHVASDASSALTDTAVLGIQLDRIGAGDPFTWNNQVPAR